MRKRNNAQGTIQQCFVLLPVHTELSLPPALSGYGSLHDVTVLTNKVLIDNMMFVDELEAQRS